MLRENRLVSLSTIPLNYTSRAVELNEKTIDALLLFHEALREAIIENVKKATSLRQLRLGFYIKSETTNILGLKKAGHLLNKIREASHVKGIMIETDIIKWYGDDGEWLAFLETTIKKNYFTKELSFQVWRDEDLDEEKLNITQASEIAEFLRNNPSIARVDFDINYLGLKEARIIMGALREHKNIKRLGLGENRHERIIVNAETLKEIADVVKEKTSISSLFFCLYEEETGAETALIDILKANHGIRNVVFRGGYLVEEDEEVILVRYSLDNRYHHHDEIVSADSTNENHREIHYLVSINRFLHKHFHELDDAGRKRIRKKIIESGHRFLNEDGAFDAKAISEYIAMSDIGEAELAISGIFPEDGSGKFKGKTLEEIAQRAKEIFLVSFHTCADHHKVHFGQKMFHIYQVLGRSYQTLSETADITKEDRDLLERVAKETREESIVYLVYSYGAKLVLDGYEDEDIESVKDEIDLDLKTLIELAAIENMQGKMSASEYQTFLENEENRQRVAEYILQVIKKYGAWLVEKQEWLVTGVMLDLFAENELETIETFHEKEIEKANKKLEQLDKKKKRKKSYIEEREATLNSDKKIMENMSIKTVLEQTKSIIEKREENLQRLKDKLLALEKEIQKFSDEILIREEHLENFITFSSPNEREEQNRFHSSLLFLTDYDKYGSEEVKVAGGKLQALIRDIKLKLDLYSDKERVALVNKQWKEGGGS